MDNHKLVKPRLVDFERPRLDDPLYIENPSPHGFHMNQTDGLPEVKLSVGFADTEAADLTPERFVCMKQDRMKEKGYLLPACENYRRQILPSTDKAHNICLRYCTAIKSESGEMTDLGNTEVLACEFREPRDPHSEELFEKFDEEIQRRQAQRREEEKPFDPLEALKGQEK